MPDSLINARQHIGSFGPVEHLVGLEYDKDSLHFFFRHGNFHRKQILTISREKPNL